MIWNNWKISNYDESSYVYALTMDWMLRAIVSHYLHALNIQFVYSHTST